MRKIFESNQHEKLIHYHSILQSHGIPSMVRNEISSVMDGMLPGNLILPELVVMNDEDYDKAMEILTPYYEGRAGEGAEAESPDDSSQ